LRTDDRFRLYVSVFLGSLGLALYAYFIPIFAQQFGATFLDLGYIGAATALTYAVAPIFVGRLADRVDRSRLYVAAILINLAATVMLAFSTSVTQIILVRVLGGLGLAFFWPITEILVLQLTPRERRVRELGLYSVSWGSAFLIGPLLGGFVIQRLGFFNLFVLSSALIIAGLPEAGLRIFHNHDQKEQLGSTTGQWIVVRRLLPWYVMVACYGMVFSIVTTIFPGYANSLGISALLVGVLFTAFGIARLVGYASSEHYFRFGERKALLLASLLIGLGSGIIELLPGFNTFLIALTILGGCFAVFYPLSIGLISRHFPDSQTGTAVGSYESIYGIGAAVGPVIAGTLATLSEVRLSFISVTFFAIIMVAISAAAKIHSQS
jgi:MFS family permease